jgi:hypothetical protein
VGELREINWSWESKDNDTRVAYLPMDGRISVADLIERMRTLAPGVPIEEMQINWATVVWKRPATQEELAQRRLAQERWESRHEEWERTTLARLIEKYGDPRATVTSPKAAAGGAPDA